MQLTSCKEEYSWRNSTVISIHGLRAAANVAGFYTPHLHEGMRLLDCGCGPGSITIGLAELVAPGEVVAIDIDARHIEMARGNAAEAGVQNVRFQTGNVYDLAFEDRSFDAVFCNAHLEHLRDPVEALREMRRVLKPGGVIGVRELDLDGSFFWPQDPLLHRFFELWIRLTRENGGDAQIGKRLATLLIAAGFQDAKMSATTELYGAAAARPFAPNDLLLEQTGFLLGEFHKRDWISEAEVNQTRQAWQRWNERPDGLWVSVRCEAIAYR